MILLLGDRDEDESLELLEMRGMRVEMDKEGDEDEEEVGLESKEDLLDRLEG